MASILSDFIQNNVQITNTNINKTTTTTTNTTTSKKYGYLCVTGSTEYNEKVSFLEKSSNVLEEPHLVKLDYLIKSIFTSSSSMHSFLINENNNLYAFGKLCLLVVIVSVR